MNESHDLAIKCIVCVSASRCENNSTRSLIDWVGSLLFYCLWSFFHNPVTRGHYFIIDFLSTITWWRLLAYNFMPLSLFLIAIFSKLEFCDHCRKSWLFLAINHHIYLHTHNYRFGRRLIRVFLLNLIMNLYILK